MAKGYHVLAGLCRDIRNAVTDAAEGSATAAKLVDDFNEMLDLLDAGCDGEVPVGPEGDDSASGSNAEDQDVPVRPVQREERVVRSVDGGGQGPTVHSTRARAQLERRRGPIREQRLIGRKCD